MNNNVNVEQFKYLQCILPNNRGNLIETLRYGDAHNWECHLRASLNSENDCLKWLAEFQHSSKSQWVESSHLNNNKNNNNSNWTRHYECKNPGCGAKMELSLQKDLNSMRDRQHPCKIHIVFCHNHQLVNQSGIHHNNNKTSSHFKTQDVPLHLKEGFEGYFQPNQMQAVSPAEVQPHRTHTNRAFQDNQKLDSTINIFRKLLKNGGSSSMAALRFMDTLQKLATHAPNHLESALNNFGAGINLNPPQQNKWSNKQQQQQQQQQQQSRQEPEELRKRKSSEDKKSKKGPVSPGEIDPLTGKRRKRSRCGNCEGCINRDKTQDCRQCRNCLDQKRYGGPGRLKKACVKRSCALTLECENNNQGGQNNNQGGQTKNGNVTLPLHPVPVSAAAAIVPNFSTWQQAAALQSVQVAQQHQQALQFTYPYNINNNNLEAITAEAARHHGLG